MWWGGGLRVLKEIGGDPDRRGRARECSGVGSEEWAQPPGFSDRSSQIFRGVCGRLGSPAQGGQGCEGGGAPGRPLYDPHTQSPSHAFQGSREPQKGSGGPS